MKDEKPRCPWPADDARMLAYHDREWGVPVHDDRGWMEHITLDAFQAGLSWRTVLHKREAFRTAFGGFDPRRVARYTQRDVARLMRDAGIIRNRAKIEATIGNARAVLDLHDGGRTLAALVWSFAPPRARVPRSHVQVPATTPQSEALSKTLRKLGFRFVGPTTAYAMMQAIGLVNDHLAGCPVRARVEKERAAAFAAIGQSR